MLYCFYSICSGDPATANHRTLVLWNYFTESSSTHGMSVYSIYIHASFTYIHVLTILHTYYTHYYTHYIYVHTHIHITYTAYC
jgi:hypothetical protein